MIFLILLLFLYFKLHKKNTFSLLLISFFCALFIILLIIYSKDAILACKSGISLWFNVVFPSLFPFFVICEILKNTKVSLVIGSFFENLMRPLFNVPGVCAFTFFLGMLSGYPIGANFTLKLYQDKLITKEEAQRLITFTNNSGPIFVISSIGYGFLKNKQIGILLYICHVLSSICVGIIFSFYKRNNICKFQKTYLANTTYKNYNDNFIKVLTNAIISSLKTIIHIAGFIVFFSVIIKLLYKIQFFYYIAKILSPITTLLNLEPNFIPSFLSGIIEITSGISLISTLSATTYFAKILSTAFLLGFAGVSIHFQIYSVICKSDINILPFFVGKFIHGVLNCLFMYLLLQNNLVY